MTPKSFFTKIAGVTDRNHDGAERQHIIRRCSVGEELRLVREFNNPDDPDAVAVFRWNGEKLGYLPSYVTTRTITGKLAFQLDRGDKYRCRISSLTGGGEKPRGVNVELTTADEWSAPPEAAVPAKVAGCMTMMVAIAVIVAWAMW